MVVTTLGEAFRLGWRVKAHCLQVGPMAKSGHGRQTVICEVVAELDMKTLLWTRGERFPLELLQSRLRCPKCGSRNVRVIFEPPAPRAAQSAS
jgi:hypothetical protein